MSKAYDYLVTLKKSDTKFYDYISQLMLLIALVAFVYAGISAEKYVAIFFYAVSALLILSWIYTVVIQKKSPVSFRIPLLIAIAGWCYHLGDHLFISLLYVLAFIFERQVKMPVEIGVDKDGVSFNNFPVKMHRWAVLNNVVIKDGIITIDYKNNKLVQRELDAEVSPALEKEFNDFCSAQLATDRL